MKAKTPAKESPLARRAREIKEARVLRPAPVMPRTKLKRRPVKVVNAVMQVPVETLHPHKLLGRAGMLPDLIAHETAKGLKQGKSRDDHKARAATLGEDYSAIRESIRQLGVLNPLKIVMDAKGGCLVVDGRHRLEIARELGLATVPCLIVAEAQAREIILAAASHRPLTKQARALHALTVYPEVAAEAKAGRPNNKVLNTLLTQPELAARAGVSLEVMKDACAFHRWLAGQGPKRAEFSNQVFAGISFAEVIAGAAGAAATKDAKRLDPIVWSVFGRKLHGLDLQFVKLAAMLEEDGQNRVYLTGMLSGWSAAHMPAAIREIWLEALQSAGKGEEP